MKTVDNLFHISKRLDHIQEILVSGFKPSYAKEKFSEYDIMVPMVSFSNILLRDVGEQEVLNYGGYGIAFTREWGMQNGLNPVAYSYEDGKLAKAIRDYFFYSLFPSQLERYKETLQEWSEKHQRCPGKLGPFSKHVEVHNNPKEVMAILDELSIRYSEEKANLIIGYGVAIRRATLPIIQLSKPYKVTNARGQEFIAYNDREWRKTYDDLDFLIAGSDDYNKWNATDKPHLQEDKYRLTFALSDVKAIMVATAVEVTTMISYLEGHCGVNVVRELLAKGALRVGTQEELIAAGF